MALKTRKPSGRAGFPKILLEGGDKSGKSYALAKLSASGKVGRTVVVILGEDETRWDEYGKMPGARFEIALHDGSWLSLLDAVDGAAEEAAKAREAGELPFVLGIDTMTAVWEGLKDWATLRARSSKKNRAILAQDPDAEIDVTSNYWNEARGRHRQLMRRLLTFPGIVVLIARGSEVTLFENGQPVANKKTWSIEGEKNLPYDVSVHVRLSRDAKPRLISAAGLACQIRPGIDRPVILPDDWSLEQVIFERLQLNAAEAGIGDFTTFKQDITPEQVLDEALNPATTFSRFRELVRITEKAFPAVEMEHDGKAGPLLAIVKTIGTQRIAAAEARKRETRAALVPLTAAEIAELGDGWVAMLDEITGPGDREPALARVADARAGGLDEAKAALIERAVEEKVALVSEKPAA